MTILHPQINPDKTLGMPPQRDDDALASASAPALNLDKLTDTLCGCCESDAQRKLIREHLPTHIGTDSTYPHKEELIKKLSAVAYVLTSNEQMKALHIHSNKKISMMDSLLSDINYCTPGFHNRVESLIHIISLPQSVGELLLAYRRVLIEDAFNEEEKRQSTNREVHTHNRFYTIASALGYGVPCNADDPYPGVKSDARIHAAIKSIFQRHYTPMNISTQLVKPLLMDALDVDPHNKNDIDHARDLACQFLGNVLRKPSINIYSIFDIDKETYEIKGIDWVKVNSLVIRHLLDEKYINPIEDAHQEQYKIGEQLTLIWDKHDQAQALLTIQTKDEDDRDITLQGYLFAPSRENLIHRVSQKDKEALLEMAYRHFLTPETAIHWIALSAATNYQDKLGELIRKYMGSITAYSEILSQLDNAGRQAIINASHAWLQERMQSTKDVSELLKPLTPEQCGAICVTMKEDILKIVQSHRGFAEILEHLSPGQCTAVTASFTDKLPTIIQSAGHFNWVLIYLTQDQRTPVFDAMKGRLPGMILSGHDFGQVLDLLSPEQRSIVFEATKDKLPDIIRSVVDFYSVLQNLSLAQRNVVHDAMKVRLPELIQSGKDFGLALCHLSVRQRTAVYEVMMEDVLPKLIESSHDFGEAIKYLSPKQQAELFETVKTLLPGIIQSADELGEALYHLDQREQRLSLATAWCKISKSNFIDYLTQNISKKDKALSIKAILNNTDDGITKFKSLYDEKRSQHTRTLFHRDFASTLPDDRAAATKMIIKNALRNPKSYTASVLFDMLQEAQEPTFTTQPRN